MVRFFFSLLILTLGLVLLLAGVYALIPTLGSWLLARQAMTLGLEHLDIRLERPALDGMRVVHVSLAADTFVLDVDHATLSWSWSSLRQGRLVGINANAASLTLLTEVAIAPSPSGTAAAIVDTHSPDLNSLFTRLPFDTAHVEALLVTLPALAATARGRLDYAADQLSVQLEGLTPDTANGLTLDARLSGSGGIDLAVAQAGSADPPFLSVRSSLPVSRLEMLLETRLTGFPLDLVAALAGLPAGRGLVTGRWQLGRPWPLDGDAPWRALTGAGRLHVDWTSADGRYAVTGLEGEMNLAGDQLMGPLTGQITGVLDGVRLTIRPSHLRLMPVPLGLEASGDVDVDMGSAHLTLAATGSATASADAASGPGASYAFSGDFTGVLNRVGEPGIPLALRGNGTLTRGALAGEAWLSSGPLKEVPLVVRYDGGQGRTLIDVDHSMVFAKPLLGGLLTGWQENYDLDGGTLRLAAHLVNEAGTGLSGGGTLTLERVAAHVGSAAVRGLSGTMNLFLDETGPRLTAGTLRASLVDFGVPMREMVVELSGTPAVVAVSSAVLKVLGGRASAAPFTYRIPEGTAETVISLEDLDLAAVLALEGAHITGTGRLDGLLPIRASTDGLSVQGGRLATRAPGGEIRLQPAIAGALTQPGLDVAMAALTNFRYALLEATVDYSAAGDLGLGIRLEGRNPDVEGGRPIHFNLNVSENIPVLLRSLRLKDEFAERIERKVQQ